MAFVEIDDFRNRFEIKTTGVGEVKLLDYIERYSAKYLRELLGVELYDLFIIGYDLSDPIYVALFAEFSYQNNYEIVTSSGIKDMLLGFIYFYYQRDMLVQQSTVGVGKAKGENSSRPSVTQANIFGRYNDSVAIYNSIQQYCTDNSIDYPTFKGVRKGYSYNTY